MPSSFIRVVLHTTFGVKFRRPLIHPGLEAELYDLLASRLRAGGCWCYGIGGTMDHIHLVHSLPRDKTIAQLMSDVKSISSKWMIARGVTDFRWQIGYGCHSVDYRSMDGLLRYVANQKQRHYGSEGRYRRQAELTFEEEFERLLRAYELPYDKRYLFPKAG